MRTIISAKKHFVKRLGQNIRSMGSNTPQERRAFLGRGEAAAELENAAEDEAQDQSTEREHHEHGADLRAVADALADDVGRGVGECAVNADAEQEHKSIKLSETSPYIGVDTFNEIAAEKYSAITLDWWSGVHPAVKIIPLHEGGECPYGLIYAKKHDEQTEKMLKIIREIYA